MTRLRAEFRTAVRSGSARRLTVLGDAGIGKTRLALELATSLGDEAHVVTGRCPPYGEGITFLPLREAVDQAVRREAGPDGTPADLVDAADAAAVSALLGLGGPSDRPGAAVDVVGRLLGVPGREADPGCCQADVLAAEGLRTRGGWPPY